MPASLKARKPIMLLLAKSPFWLPNFCGPSLLWLIKSIFHPSYLWARCYMDGISHFVSLIYLTPSSLDRAGPSCRGRGPSTTQRSGRAGTAHAVLGPGCWASGLLPNYSYISKCIVRSYFKSMHHIDLESIGKICNVHYIRNNISVV